MSVSLTPLTPLNQILPIGNLPALQMSTLMNPLESSVSHLIGPDELRMAFGTPDKEPILALVARAVVALITGRSCNFNAERIPENLKMGTGLDIKELLKIRQTCI